MEPRADTEAIAFALAVSDVPSEDLFLASKLHPMIRERFSTKGKQRIAEKAFLFREDEHDRFYIEGEWDSKLHGALRREQRFERENELFVFSSLENKIYGQVPVKTVKPKNNVTKT